MSERKTSPDPELLEANHSFPCSYIIKAFGPEGGSFRVEIRDAVKRAALPGKCEIHERLSSKGNRVCMTIEFHAESVQDVQRLYEKIHEVEELKLIL